MENPGELDGDVTAADHQHTLGQFFEEEGSLELIACSCPGISGICGQPPVAIRICLAVKR
jgi:hypothetical protein